MASFLSIVLLIHVSLVILALVDCLTADPRSIRGLPQAGWVVVIALASPVGALAWLLAGKPLVGGGKYGARPVRRRAAAGPIGPEDDPTFIASLAAALRQSE